MVCKTTSNTQNKVIKNKENFINLYVGYSILLYMYFRVTQVTYGSFVPYIDRQKPF